MNAQQLKNAILQEAIEGRLVPQDSNDERASVLLARIRKEKEQLVKEGKLKKKDLEVKPISEDEIPFEIPESWEWCRVEDLIYPPKYGTSNKSLENGAVPVLRMGNIQDGEIVFDKLVFSNDKADNEKYNLISGDLLFNRTNSAELVGKTAIYRGQRPAIYAGYLILLRPIEIDSEYLNFVLGSNYARSYCQEVKTIGVQQCNINAEKISVFIVPLPPLAEQHRIVAKIEELLPKVEEYGKAQDALNKLNAELPERLKKSILQEAIEGRLVPQDPNDEPASVLLDKIRQEKAQLVKAGKLKKKDLIETPITEDEIPFEIPKTWEWVRISEISESYIGLTYKPTDVSDKGWIVLRSSNIQDGKIDYNDIIRVNIDVPAKLHVHNNDIIICARNGSKKLVGKSAIVKNATEPITFGAFMAICRTQFYQYMSMYLLSPLFFYQLRKDSDTTTINQLTQKNFNRYIVPFPPLAEQHRIMEKLEQLLGKIEQMNK